MLELLFVGVCCFALGYIFPLGKKSRWTDKDLKEAVQHGALEGIRHGHALGSQQTADTITAKCLEEGVDLTEILGTDPIEVATGTTKSKLH